MRSQDEACIFCKKPATRMARTPAHGMIPVCQMHYDYCEGRMAEIEYESSQRPPYRTLIDKEKEKRKLFGLE
jgi:hypothetical protein